MALVIFLLGIIPFSIAVLLSKGMKYKENQNTFHTTRGKVVVLLGILSFIFWVWSLVELGPNAVFERRL